MHLKTGKLILVAPAGSSIQVPATRQLIHVENISRIFPAIHEIKPTGIVLDYDYLGNDTEKVLRRIAANPFYQKLKIYCYKSREHTRVDSFLKALGVQYFIYGESSAKQQNKTVKALNEIIEATVVSKLADASY